MAEMQGVSKQMDEYREREKGRYDYPTGNIDQLFDALSMLPYIGPVADALYPEGLNIDEEEQLSRMNRAQRNAALDAIGGVHGYGKGMDVGKKNARDLYEYRLKKIHEGGADLKREAEEKFRKEIAKHYVSPEFDDIPSLPVTRAATNMDRTRMHVDDIVEDMIDELELDTYDNGKNFRSRDNLKVNRKYGIFGAVLAPLIYRALYNIIAPTEEEVEREREAGNIENEMDEEYKNKEPRI